MQSPKPYLDTRPWGEELWLTRDSGAPTMVKVITVKPGESLSLQYHRRREEFWLVLSGDGSAEIAEQALKLKSGDTCFIPREVKHRISGGSSVLKFLELSFGDFDENDIIRLEDKYGRK